MTKVYLCSFASPDLDLSVKRFINQSKNLMFYEDIKIFRIKDLSEELVKQINSFSYPVKNKRLFGYACWKPYVIKTYLNQIPKNSILQYSDIGCHFNINGKNKLWQYVDLCNKKNALTFQYRLPEWKNFKGYKYQEYFEYQFTKGDVWRFMKIKNDSKILNSEQIWSGSLFFKNNLKSKKIVNEWYNLTKINYLIDDSPSKSKNHNLFEEHRHDQSIFSILCKKNNIYNLSASECEWAVHKKTRTWNHLNNFPILAKRDKKFNLIKRFINRQKKNLKRLLHK